VPARLEIGLRLGLSTRKEEVDLGLGLKILYISDLHLRPSNQDRIIAELNESFHKEKPALVLLGGDLADHPASLDPLSSVIAGFSKEAVVGAVWGNHDTLVGRSRVKDAVVRSGGHWLPDAPLQTNGLQLLGASAQFQPGLPAVLCSHYPTDFPAARKAGIDLVFAGHLHGWQIVLGQWGEYLYPGAWLSRWNGLRFQREDSIMLVSRGVTDLLPIRWNCPREVILASV
jgi:predicted MPP superfamily phosphohydrolase